MSQQVFLSIIDRQTDRQVGRWREIGREERRKGVFGVCVENTGW